MTKTLTEIDNILGDRGNLSLRYSGLSTRIRNTLYKVGIVSYKDAMETSPDIMVGIYGLSVRALARIIDELQVLGFDYCERWQIQFNAKKTEFAYLSWSS